MSGNISVKGTTYASVDTVYDGMDEGQRMHMANKLNKHGYGSPRVSQEPSVSEVLADAVEKYGRSHVLLLAAEAGR